MIRPLRLLVKAAITVVLSGLSLPVPMGVAWAAEGFSSKLELALNGGDAQTLTELVPPESLSGLQRRYDRFSKEFPDARWTVRPLATLDDGRRTLEVLVRGERESDGLQYQLEASQRLAVRIEAGRLMDQELLMEQSLLRSGKSSLPVTLDIPDAVLTGSRYDVDVIFDQPLGNAVVAGGLLSLTPEQVLNQIRPNLTLEPMGGGGLFKTVQAPQRPGAQTWAAMLVHPDGVVTVTKRVRVVNQRRDLAP